MKPKVSIIFPTLNGWLDTKNCLSSIKKLDYPSDRIEIIVVDNASTDQTVNQIKKQFPKVKIFPQKNNLGFAKAVNLGIKKAYGKYLLVTNNDVVFDKKYLSTLVDYLQKNPLVGIVGGKVSYSKPKNRIAFCGAKFNFYTGTLSLGKTPNLISETDWLPGCNLLTTKEVLKTIGGFDEKFFFYFEDLDLCLRAKKAGYKVIYHPKASLWHDEGKSVKREKKRKKDEYYYQGKTRVLFKHATKIQLTSSLLFQFLIGLPFQLLVLKRFHYPTTIRALIKNVKIS